MLSRARSGNLVRGLRFLEVERPNNLLRNHPDRRQPRLHQLRACDTWKLLVSGLPVVQN
jgi:hypothetical protein